MILRPDWTVFARLASQIFHLKILRQIILEGGRGWRENLLHFDPNHKYDGIWAFEVSGFGGTSLINDSTHIGKQAKKKWLFASCKNSTYVTYIWCKTGVTIYITLFYSFWSRRQFFFYVFKFSMNMMASYKERIYKEENSVTHTGISVHKSLCFCLHHCTVLRLSNASYQVKSLHKCVSAETISLHVLGTVLMAYNTCGIKLMSNPPPSPLFQSCWTFSHMIEFFFPKR